MRTEKCLLTISTVLLYQLLAAQSFVLYGDKTYGGNGEDVKAFVTKAGSNQFIISGISRTNVNGDKTDPQCDTTVTAIQDNWLLKIDASFNIVWDKDIGGNFGEDLPQLISTGYNKQFIFSCSSNSDSACERSGHNWYNTLGSNTADYWICLIDSNGNKIWDKTLGGDSEDEFPQIIRLSNGDYIVCGTSFSDSASGDKTVSNYGGRDYWAVKLDSTGHKLWDKVYGGSGQEWSGGGNENYFYILPCENGSFILAGSSGSPASGLVSDTSRGGATDVWIIKIDNNGNKIWDKRYGGALTDNCNHITHTNDGGYILCGWTNSQQGFDVSESSRGSADCWVIKLDSLGNKQWDKRYGGNNADKASWIEPDLEGGYCVSATTQSDSSHEVTEPTYGGNADYWIFKIDSAGNKLWDKRFGGPGYDAALNFVIMPDSSIYLCGYAATGTSAVKTDSGKGGPDYWLVHFKYGFTFTGAEELGAGSWELGLSPNPATNICTIKLKNTLTLQYSNTLTLYDIAGRVLLRQPFTGRAELDVSGFAGGVYLVEVKDKEGGSVQAKLVKQ